MHANRGLLLLAIDLKPLAPDRARVHENARAVAEFSCDYGQFVLSQDSTDRNGLFD